MPVPVPMVEIEGPVPKGAELVGYGGREEAVVLPPVLIGLIGELEGELEDVELYG